MSGSCMFFASSNVSLGFCSVDMLCCLANSTRRPCSMLCLRSFAPPQVTMCSRVSLTRQEQYCGASGGDALVAYATKKRVSWSEGEFLREWVHTPNRCCVFVCAGLQS